MEMLFRSFHLNSMETPRPKLWKSVCEQCVTKPCEAQLNEDMECHLHFKTKDAQEAWLNLEVQWGMEKQEFKLHDERK